MEGAYPPRSPFRTRFLTGGCGSAGHDVASCFKTEPRGFSPREFCQGFSSRPSRWATVSLWRAIMPGRDRGSARRFSVPPGLPDHRWRLPSTGVLGCCLAPLPGLQLSDGARMTLGGYSEDPRMTLGGMSQPESGGDSGPLVIPDALAALVHSTSRAGCSGVNESSLMLRFAGS